MELKDTGQKSKVFRSLLGMVPGLRETAPNYRMPRIRFGLRVSDIIAQF